MPSIATIAGLKCMLSWAVRCLRVCCFRCGMVGIMVWSWLTTGWIRLKTLLWEDAYEYECACQDEDGDEYAF